MSTAARRRWNGRSLSVTRPRSSFVGWIGSSSSRRRGVFKKSGATQQPPYSSTWHAKNYWILIMRGGGIRRRFQQSRREESRERRVGSGGREWQGETPGDPGGGRGPVQHLTSACRRPPIASAPASLRLSAAPEARRSAS